jgi:hypothetical protein
MCKGEKKQRAVFSKGGEDYEKGRRRLLKKGAN